MTGSGVERLRRTASRLSSVRRPGVATPPPPSQVEGRTERRTGSRWGLRTFLVGGFAGVAWLLSGAAAHAADHQAHAEAASDGSSVVSLVRALGHEGDECRTTNPAAGLLDGAVPTDGVTKAADTLGTSVTSTIDPGTSRPARQPSDLSGPIDVLPGDLLDLGDDVDPVATVLAAPARLIDGPARTRGVLSAATETDPIVRKLRPVAGLLSSADPAASSDSDADLSAISFAPGQSPSPAGTVLSADGATTELAPAASAARDDAGRTSWIALQRFAAAHLPDALSATTGLDEAPDSPVPAPLRAHLGAVSGGASTGGSGAPTDGGSATAPSSVVDSAVAAYRLPMTTDVEVRRHDAEAPTVSPD
jgi:hypothetical protein